MTTVDSITDSALKTSLEYSVMDGDLNVTMNMTPSGGVKNTAILNTTLIIATSRMLTEDEKTKALALDFTSIEDQGPASNGFSMTYMDISGVAQELVDTPVEA